MSGRAMWRGFYRRPAACQRLASRLALAVAAVALAGLAHRLRFLAPVGRQRPADVVAFLELPRRTAADEPFIGAGVDQFALPGRPAGLARPALRGTLRRALRSHSVSFCLWR